MKKLILMCILIGFCCCVIKAQEPLKANAGTDQHFCYSGDDRIEVIDFGNPVASGGTPPYTYHWKSNYKNGSVIYVFHATDSIPSIYIAPAANVTIYVEVTDADFNVATDSMVITTSGKQLDWAGNLQNLQRDYYINLGDSVFLNGNVLTLNPNSTFLWSPNGSIVSNYNVSDGFWAKPTDRTAYKLTATDEFGCEETFYTAHYLVRLEADNNPLVANAGTDQHFCYASDWEQATLGGNPTASGGVPPYTYHWRAKVDEPNTISSATDSNPYIDFLGTIYAYVEIIDSIDNIAIDTIVITMSGLQLHFADGYQDLQRDYYINIGDSVFLNGNVDVLNPNSTFAWSPCESIVSDCTVSDGFWAKPTVTTAYELTATDEFGCSETFWDVFYKVYVNNTGINEDFITNNFVFPNPFNNYINVFTNNAAKISIYDISGKIIYQSELYKEINEISTKHFTQGIYFVEIQNKDNSIQIFKIVKS